MLAANIQLWMFDPGSELILYLYVYIYIFFFQNLVCKTKMVVERGAIAAIL